MIQQPALGKKIADQRRAKGFTQEELVEKCNINVRTLQRIEAGEVTPRISTIKLIFEALEIEFENAVALNSSEDTIAKKPQNHFLELLNFKTNPMKKLLILLIPILSIIAMFVVMATQKTTFDDTKVKRSDVSEASGLFIKYYNSGQIDSIGILFLENASFMPSNHRELRGRNEIVDYYHGVYNSGFRLNVDKPTFIIISDSIAIEKGIWEGNNNGTFSGNYLTQWRLKDGNWFMENTMNHKEY
ncbi:helix-turn-helix domain-containing protein [Kordia sp. YSTF-M3]|uniref:Helix-turn-helix domain-containing protein n=1 Tax=Kordia aestuariivivens TaxID=2759037 RepID=A0ABR7QD06_9FLAO|nr:helix-turn-helix transcriptional regulator [Kordia aestuariivivens]MBC8756261.1 helix-turn-helix domain-containing protein [Kordia aestuariivivens]